MSWSATAQIRGADSLYHKSYLKIDLSLLIYDAKGYPHKWFGIQYEHLIGKKLTLGVSANYSWGTQDSGGIPTFQNSNEMSFAVAPQLRRYLGKQAFKGLYVGPSLYYQYIDRSLDKGVLFGPGVTAGYQFFVLRKFPVDINLVPMEMFENLEHPDYAGQVISSKKAYFKVGGGIYVGFPVGWKRK